MNRASDLRQKEDPYRAGLREVTSSAPSQRATIRRPVGSMEGAWSAQSVARDRAAGRISPRSIQVALGLLWLLDGLLQLQPFMFTKGFVSEVIAGNTAGQPAIIGVPITWAAHFMAPHIALWNTAFAVIQIAIGLGLLWRRTVKQALLLSFAWALGVWWFGEGFGGLATGAASMLTGAPGAVILYAIVGLVVWPRTEQQSGFGAVGLLGASGARVAWCVLWLGAAAFSILPAQRAPGALSDVLSGNAAEAPAFLASVERWLAHAATGRGFGISLAIAALEAAIGVGALIKARARPFLILGIGVSLIFWAVGQNLGMLFSGTSTDPDAAPLYVLLALACLVPPTERAGSAPYR
jgi:hypothetical protein